MGARTARETVDLSGYPDLVVIYLGMRVNTMRGLRTLAKTGARIRQGVAASPEGLLRHEFMLFSLAPPHLGMRQYWRDFDSLERWARSDPHRAWWSELLADSAGTGFWHETYFSRGGVEAIYLDLAASPLGLGAVVPRQQARKSMFSARSRLGVGGPGETTPAMSEQDVYGDLLAAGCGAARAGCPTSWPGSAHCPVRKRTPVVRPWTYADEWPEGC